MRRRFLHSPNQLFASAWKNRELILRLARREVEGRYRASVLGIVWSILVPLLMLLVYTIVFSVIFESRWGTQLTNRYQFSIVLFAGMICFNFLTECMGRAPNLMFENINYIKKVVFPLEILAWIQVLVAFFNLMISFLVLAVAYAFVLGIPPVTTFAIPFILIPLIFLSLAVLWLLSSFAVYVPDIRQAIGIIITILMFLSPIFYPIEAAPEKLRFLLSINPLGYTVESVRGALFWGTLPDPLHFAYAVIGSFILAWLSFSWFQATKKGFADVL